MANFENQTTEYIEELLEMKRELLENDRAAYRAAQENMLLSGRRIQQTSNDILVLTIELKRRFKTLIY